MQLTAACLPPPENYAAPDFQVPARACDSHCHVTPEDFLNTVPDASYEPAPAPPAELRRLRRSIKFERSVVVQASVYGKDNRAVEQALRAEPQVLRGVVVGDADTTDAQLDAWHAMGVRGMRFIMSGQLGGTVDLNDLKVLAPKLADRGWHAEILPREDQWPSLKSTLEQLPCTLVVDHLGGLSLGAQSGEAEHVLSSLLSTGRVWVKLIGYRLSADLRDPRIARRAQRLYSEAPTRMVWGTDWPHVGFSVEQDAGILLNALASWFDHDASAIERILASNPEELFDFPRAAVRMDPVDPIIVTGTPQRRT
ncbi:amidohydrolase family protein [Variovorax boronicumulans]|uniref:amidohydrolase family protein n=1 Tax=Variovorax boronicumulans TaxID=436515 RepID=UPI0012E69304|nr:amidohydrolase family protein [Variovorax boronicumulans]GER10150.1 hypothetical protein VHAB30_13050 [Variovorax boronicumulans]